MLEWTDAFAILLAAHLLGDFYFQPKRMAEEKGVSLGMFLAHCAIYAACMAPCCWLLFEGWCQAILAWGIVSVSHIAIDAAKRRLLTRLGYIKPRVELYIFVADQMAHVVICAFVAMVFASNPVVVGVLQSSLLADGGVSVAGVVALALSLLTVGRPAAILIRMFLSLVDGPAGASEHANDARIVEGQQEKASAAVVCTQESDYIRAGKWIGILERIIVVVMTFWGEYGAIAFVFTAKSIARFKMLDDRYFAERYLVGTLASVAFAILATLLAKGMLAV